MNLDDIKSPADIKNLSQKELKQLASDIRERIISVVAKNGGHLASNLGVVELTIALHRVFNSPGDAIVWDVSHQAYTHKILTGRNAELDSLRTHGGISGFTRHEESPHDWFDSGHASASISQALGLATGRALSGSEGRVIAVIGDGALTGGLAFEALAHAGQISDNLIVIVNDNEMSIEHNDGTVSRYLSRMTMTGPYQNLRWGLETAIDKIPLIGKPFNKFFFRLKRGIKAVFFPSNLFVDFGFEYVGPLNGHDMEELEMILNRVKKLRRPVVVHVKTQKGRGYSPAENDPASFHGIGPFNISDGKVEKYDRLSFTEVFSEKILDLAEKHENIVAITASMKKGTGLSKFAYRYPDRFYDVGIAEEHAVTFAGGLAKAGMKPVVAIYSTFMQRAVDQLIHDVALQGVAPIFILDRSGAVPDDGETHQGVFDIALLRPVPDVSLLAPASAEELRLSLDWAIEQDVPVIIRYPKSSCPYEQHVFSSPFQIGRGVLIHMNEFRLPDEEEDGIVINTPKETDVGVPIPENNDKKRLFVCTGGIFPEVSAAARFLIEHGLSCDIYNLRFLKPLDKEYFIEIARQYDDIVFVEDGIRIGGIGTYLESLLNRYHVNRNTAVCGFRDTFVPQGKRSEILEDAHLSPAYLARKMLSL
ncbi:MAG: 1-deoxy-D-xylulose-5-phosphate synthase [Treponema sp.]|nr:1-deoxy-D-xylulose-5-phosphate synthase [Candidatus Treponema caballi]